MLWSILLIVLILIVAFGFVFLCIKFTTRGDENIEEKETKVNNMKKEKTIQDNKYTNAVAHSFKNWSNGVLIVGIIVLIIIIIVSIIVKSIYVFISAWCVYSVFIANALILSAIAEIIQKLQNIEDNTRK